MGDTNNDLRAICPTCHRPQRVVLRGKTWRMVAHTREVSAWRGVVTKACPVRSLDAREHIQQWLDATSKSVQSEIEYAAKERVQAAALLASADKREANAQVERDRIEALRAVFLGGRT